MIHKGSCHCGNVAFEVEGDIKGVIDCNCSFCSRRGGLLWFVPRDNLRMLTPESNLKAYTFGEGNIQHLFCTNCGIHPLGQGTGPDGKAMAAINVRCLEGIDLGSLKVRHFDGKSL